jgi:sugar phosphate isomerase/epimerase
MRVGLYTDALPALDRRGVLAWCADRGIEDVEMGVGAWGPEPRRHLDLQALLAERSERDRLQSDLAEFGLRLACVNAAGNVLHPDPAARADAQARLTGALELAAALGVDRVVTMSGCPGAPGGSPIGIWAVWSSVADDEGLYAWQLEHEVAPFWREQSRRAAEIAPDVRICLELHAGLAAYNPASFQQLAEVTGRNVGVNLDPSHFWWQGIDPLAVVEALGDRIGFAHAKDTTVYPERVRLNGVNDHRFPPDPAVNSWHFSAVGEGHDDATWTALLAAIRAAGHDGTVSIEHEDPRYDGAEGVERSLAGLRRALAALP